MKNTYKAAIKREMEARQAVAAVYDEMKKTGNYMGLMDELRKAEEELEAALKAIPVVDSKIARQARKELEEELEAEGVL